MIPLNLAEVFSSKVLELLALDFGGLQVCVNDSALVLEQIGEGGMVRFHELLA